jgi:hypothetical protein
VDKVLDRAVKWVETMQDKRSGNFGYGGPNEFGGGHRLTGAGTLALQVWKHANSGAAQHGVRAILEDSKLNYQGPDANLYAWYYETQACINAGGEHWNKWNKAFQDQILDNQSEDGSWPPTGGKAAWASGNMGGDGEIYRTALCTLMLEVFYRYLPSSRASGG